MIVYKQAYTLDRRCIVIVELRIPSTAHVTKALGYDRCDYAYVVSITSIDGKHHIDKAVSMKDGRFIYEVGKMVVADFDVSLGSHPGIYFFKMREQAVEYEF